MHNFLYAFEWEYFKRPRWWWTVFSMIGAGLILLALFWSHWAQWGDGGGIWYEDILNAVILIMLYAWYVFWVIKHDEAPTVLKILDEWMLVWMKPHNWQEYKWFLLEANRKTWVLKNIVLVYQKGHIIHTILEDDMSKIDEFVTLLEEKIPLLETYEQSMIEKTMRKLRL